MWDGLRAFKLKKEKGIKTIVRDENLGRVVKSVTKLYVNSGLAHIDIHYDRCDRHRFYYNQIKALSCFNPMNVA